MLMEIQFLGRISKLTQYGIEATPASGSSAFGSRSGLALASSRLRFFHLGKGATARETAVRIECGMMDECGGRGLWTSRSWKPRTASRAGAPFAHHFAKLIDWFPR